MAHCAGPFSATAGPMARACVNAGVHYLDITGEIDVFEELHGLDDRARAAGSVLLPGAGFDVVPTDCMAALLAEALPGASRLDLAFMAGGGPSPGTAKTAVQGMSAGRPGPDRRGDHRGAVRLADDPGRVPGRDADGRVGAVGRRQHRLLLDRHRQHHYLYRPAARGPASQPDSGPLRDPAAGPGAPAGRVLRLAGALAGRSAGPSEQRRARSGSEVWGRASAGDQTAHGTLSMPNAYALTADSVVRAVTRLGSVPPGFHTPSTAFGPRYVTELDGVTLDGPH